MARMLEKNMQMLRFIGLCMAKDVQKGFPYYLRRMLVGSICFWIIYGYLYGWPMYVLQHSDNFSEVTETLGNMVGATIPIFAFLTLLFQSNDLEELVEILRKVDEFKRPNDEYTKAVVDKTKKRCNFITTTLPRRVSIVCGIMVMISGLSVIKERDISDRLNYVFPVDLNRPAAFEITIVAVIINYFANAFVTLAADILIACMFVNLLGQLQILSHKIRVVRKSAEASVQDKTANLPQTSEQETPLTECKVELDTNERWNCLAKSNEDEVTNAKTKVDPELATEIELEMESALAECIDHHTMILIFIKKFEKIWNALFSAILCSCLAQSVLVLTSSAMKTGDTSLMAHFAITSMYYLMLGGFCWLSQQVTNESELLQESIYGCSWIDASASFKKSVGIMISMSNQPLVIKAAGFVPMSMETLGSVLNSAYSLYMVMRSF